jgi:hypothetical protein
MGASLGWLEDNAQGLFIALYGLTFFCESCVCVAGAAQG